MKNKEIIFDKKEAMRKTMEGEMMANSYAHGFNMIGKIVNYAYDKHVRKMRDKNIKK